MHFIIFDLEATCWKGRPPGLVQETIEIGALKVDGYGEVSDIFNRFIRPVVNPLLSAFCQELTGIEQKNIDRADKFPVVIEAFMDWLEVENQDYLLCSWGNFDKKMLAQDCRLHKMEEDWLEHHINLKDQYRQIKRLPEVKGLKSTVEKEGFEFEGFHHRGIDDAHNLAKIFVKYIDEWLY